MKQRPTVLCIGGHDPTGGAGIQADIETASALGARATTLLTALTVQDSHDVHAVETIKIKYFKDTFDTLIADIAPDGVKIGLIGDAGQVDALAGRLRGFRGPLVLDPVLAAGGGTDLASGQLVTALRERLLPHCTLLTPNRAEARRLTDMDDADSAARELLAAGARAVLLTGADEAHGEQVVNRLFVGDKPPRSFFWPRLAGSYHGSGCTLASACAVLLAQGHSMDDAVARAQAFTARALERATSPGAGQHLPGRLA